MSPLFFFASPFQSAVVSLTFLVFLRSSSPQNFPLFVSILNGIPFLALTGILFPNRLHRHRVFLRSPMRPDRFYPPALRYSVAVVFPPFYTPRNPHYTIVETALPVRTS